MENDKNIEKISQENMSNMYGGDSVNATSGKAITEPLLRRAYMFLEDGEFESANEYCERVLDIDPENAQAYLIKLMAELHVRKQDELADCEEPFDNRNNYLKMMRFGDENLLAELSGYIIQINERKEQTVEANRISKEKRRKRNKKIYIATSIIAVCTAFILVLNFVIVPANYRATAKTLYGNILNDVEVGNIFEFGTYEQDNGPEAIRWLVLAKEANKVLVVSKYGLDCQPYNTTDTDVTWGNCSLRYWLNSTFFNTAFDGPQQTLIPSTPITNSNNIESYTTGRDTTNDKVFLLSIDEAQKYFYSDFARQVQVTAYAQAKGAFADAASYGAWWLRSPGDKYYGSVTSAAAVSGIGSFYSHGSSVVEGNNAVRPALWIDVSNLK